MSLYKSAFDLLRSLKITYIISNLFNYQKLKRNIPLYKKYGLKKSVIAPLSSKDFKNLKSDIEPWLDKYSLKEISMDNHEFQTFPKEIQVALTNWSEEGYAILPEFFKKEADQVNQNIEELLASGKVNFKYGNKIMFALHQSELIKSMGNDPMINKVLSFLLGKEVKLFQSINFIKGSEQRAHSDSIHMSTYPQGFLIAIWVALEDIKEEQGALFYYPGSNQLPYLSNEDYDYGGNYWMLGRNANKKYEDKIEEIIREKNLLKKVFEAKKGDVLIWHANLIHGGSKVLDNNFTRKSMVFHYYTEEVICYHEITQRPSVF
jgi:ectoine hydroxylase-related dioxygenase (phytanoyl-CoA dioxygenase family)